MILLAEAAPDQLGGSSPSVSELKVSPACWRLRVFFEDAAKAPYAFCQVQRTCFQQQSSLNNEKKRHPCWLSGQALDAARWPPRRDRGVLEFLAGCSRSPTRRAKSWGRSNWRHPSSSAKPRTHRGRPWPTRPRAGDAPTGGTHQARCAEKAKLSNLLYFRATGLSIRSKAWKLHTL